MILTVGINVLIGSFMWAIYRLRREQLCFWYWGLSCLLFAAGCVAAGARAFVEAPWLTVVMAYGLLVLAPLFVLCGLVRFVDGRTHTRTVRGLFYGVAACLLLIAVFRESPYAPRLFTAAYTAAIFVCAFYLTRRIRPGNALPVRALQLFFLIHCGMMLLQVVTLTRAWQLGASVDADPVLDSILISHILLANATALTFPLLAFVRSEQHLRSLAESDDLTGLCNRRSFHKRGQAMFADAVRRQRPLTVLMVDLDHFKTINDRWGHPVGDEVLCFIARLLREELRETDIIGRIGGEEFAVALPDTTEDQARLISERLREKVFERGAEIAGNPIQLSASFGGVHRCGNHRTFNELLMQADSALYVAKDQGRNQVHFNPCRSLPA
ncbi:MULTISPECIES: sensor domain-containing diguanylate cyclase [Marinobacter]|uniref:GGDEF domain-containing protein n=1 Tax=Marinobacter TaxID=2742 RepID=UPI000DABA8D3|nr:MULTISPECIES: GGDEF domain-containing protein [Marinobacter]